MSHAPWSGLSDMALSRLAHDLAGTTRALRDIPDWIAEDLASAGHDPSSDLLQLVGHLGDSVGTLDQLCRRLAMFVQVGHTPCVLGEPLALAATAAEICRGLPIAPQLEVPEMRVHLSYADLDILLREAMANAIAFHPAGTPSVVLSAGPPCAGEIKLTVRDDGPGIPVGFCERAFAPFERAPVAGRKPGVGLGLSIIARICERLGGEAGFVRRGPGFGASLELRLPVAAG